MNNSETQARPLTEDERAFAESRIVADFVGSDHDRDRYLFDQIANMPTGYVDAFMDASRAIKAIARAHRDVFVLLDRHPNNASSAREVAEALGDADKDAFEVPVALLGMVVAYDQCDMYVTSTEGQLLIVGCHEDRVEENGRIVWCPVRKDE